MGFNPLKIGSSVLRAEDQANYDRRWPSFNPLKIGSSVLLAPF